jgi:hypothetical protein
LGDNVNGPSLIRVPAWVKRPLGRYYLYFGHHRGEFLRMAYADSLVGPWKIYEPGVQHVRDTAFDRPDRGGPGDMYTHVASPEAYVDNKEKRILLWSHGFWTEGKTPPTTNRENTTVWLKQNQYGQFTQVAESEDGIHFKSHSAITRESYLRVFPYRDSFYGMARLGVLLRSKDPLGSFEVGPNPFRGTAYADRVRHVAMLLQGRKLLIFFSAIGDSPERIMVSTMELNGDWAGWKATVPVEVLTSLAGYECADLPVNPSMAGDVKGRVRQMRDPALFQENGKVYLFYSICGEQGIAGAELKLP